MGQIHPEERFDRVVIFGGSGDTGRRLARAWAERGQRVEVTTRQPEELSDGIFERVGVAGWGGPGDREGLRGLVDRWREESVQRLLAYNVVGAWLADPEEAIVGVVETLTEQLKGRFDRCRLVHCGATSVYGDRPGEVLDERSPLADDLKVGRIHRRAEEHLQAASGGDFDPLILRLPHIYGPGRERTPELMARGEFVVCGDGTNPMHHIHIADVTRALVAAGTAPAPDPPIINVVDDQPATYGDYCDFITDYFDRPPLERLSLSEAKRTGRFARLLGPHLGDEAVLEEFYAYMTSRVTIRNDRMREVLGVDLEYPSFRAGLPDVLEEIEPPTDNASIQEREDGSTE